MPAINEGFTEGGDLTIQSTDGINFSVHSLFLSVASPVFSGLLKATHQNEIVRFSERAELLALVLKFIYPLPSPIIPSIDLLNEAMRVANKYQLDSMKARLREQLTLADSPVSTFSNPLGVLCVASVHGFTAEAELAAKVASKQYDFGRIDDLKMLVDACPATASLVKLVGIPAVKTRVLIECAQTVGKPTEAIQGKARPSGRFVGLIGSSRKSRIARSQIGKNTSVIQISFGHFTDLIYPSVFGPTNMARTAGFAVALAKFRAWAQQQRQHSKQELEASHVYNPARG
ncbi:hypothetical protein FRC11_014085 [Ceratobasidium sp. 423]|nr:hypothetical protein FRC11_014085 [Ceratobasidium sp. 423]